MNFPFGAVVGMDDMRRALVLNAISPAVGGVLVRGEKGTATSTAVRALAPVLPPVDVVTGCSFACDPHAPDPACPDGPHHPGAPGHTRPARLVELPVGASEDRGVGALDLERALTEGVKAFEPGLPAAANRGVLHVDEVNLLHDHVVDLLLDAAAHVEREGVSVRHGSTVVMSTHDVDLALRSIDEVAVVVDRTVAEGAPGAVLGDDPLLRRARLERPWALTVDARLRDLGLLPDDGVLPRDVAGLLGALPARPGVPT